MNNIEYIKKYGKEEELETNLKRLEAGEPVQYIVGNVDFYDVNLNVDKRVLIPRFETEELVSKTIEYAKKLNIKKALDIGTGSGCIAITLKKHLNVKMTACDISIDALEVAKSNALKNEVEINFLESDIYSNVKGKFDLIISNPPYIKTDEPIEEIVYNNEPHLALYSGIYGLDHYTRILKDAKKHLNDNYLIAFEIGETQGNDIINLAKKYLHDDINIKLEQDMQGRDRFIFIERIIDNKRHENELNEQGIYLIGGVDEVGRGPLNGPVVAACCCLNKDFNLDGLTDSKKISEKKREEYYEYIIKNSVYGIGYVEADEIDKINIYEASRRAMIKAINEVQKQIKLEYVLSDAMPIDIDIPVKPIIKGDQLSISISAASVIAKVTRDRLMLELDKKYPEYGYKNHKGYPTKEHIEAINKYGLIDGYRLTYGPVMEVLNANKKD